LVGLLGAMAIVVDEGAETAEGAMVAGVDCVCSIECGIEKSVALYDLWRAEEQARWIERYAELRVGRAYL
jgi:hypothetical protein